VVSVLVVAPDETIRRLLEDQLRVLGRPVAWSGAEPPTDGLHGADVAIVDPAARRALEFAAEAGLPLVLVSVREPTSETRALEPRAHLTLPFGLDELAAALGPS
jgi:CheY-like chemotaxis protein